MNKKLEVNEIKWAFWERNWTNEEKYLFRKKIHTVIFGTHTKAGRLFDIILLVLILVSVTLMMLESIAEINKKYFLVLRVADWIFTLIFTLEYIARIYCLKKPKEYVTSFFGIIDLASILPTFLGILFAGLEFFSVVRTIRLLRVFRILKLVQFLGESNTITSALKASKYKIIVFLVTVMCTTLILGTAMYVVEGAENGFTSIPKSIYWSIVTITTVGYGDIAPQTPLGQFIASVMMIIGYGIIAVPTGIVSAEMNNQKQNEQKNITKQEKIAQNLITCSGCGNEEHDDDAEFCKKCGQSVTD